MGIYERKTALFAFLKTFGFKNESECHTLNRAESSANFLSANATGLLQACSHSSCKFNVPEFLSFSHSTYRRAPMSRQARAILHILSVMPKYSCAARVSWLITNDESRGNANDVRRRKKRAFIIATFSSAVYERPLRNSSTLYSFPATIYVIHVSGECS